jgi:hypothetical protein
MEFPQENVRRIHMLDQSAAPHYVDWRKIAQVIRNHVSLMNVQVDRARKFNVIVVDFEPVRSGFCEWKIRAIGAAHITQGLTPQIIDGIGAAKSYFGRSAKPFVEDALVLLPVITAARDDVFSPGGGRSKSSWSPLRQNQSLNFTGWGGGAPEVASA